MYTLINLLTEDITCMWDFPLRFYVNGSVIRMMTYSYFLNNKLPFHCCTMHVASVTSLIFQLMQLRTAQFHNERISTDLNLVTWQSTVHEPPEGGLKNGTKTCRGKLLSVFNEKFLCFFKSVYSVCMSWNIKEVTNYFVVVCVAAVYLSFIHTMTSSDSSNNYMQKENK
jgi:hypothetical protein